MAAGRPKTVIPLERGYEQAVADALREKGWEVLTKGWPDLLCVRQQPSKGAYSAAGRWYSMAVELKRGTDRLRPDQERMARIFTDILGIRHYVAHDDEIQEILRKKGKVHTVLPGEQIDHLAFELNECRAKYEWIGARIEELETKINETITVFDLTRESDVGMKRRMVERYGEGL